MHIRSFSQADLDAVLHVETVAWGDAAASGDQILTRWDVFPEGSIVAEMSDGRIVGYAAAQRVNAISMGTWCDQTDNGWIVATHRPQGAFAYGVGMSALPAAARFGVGRHVIDHYRRIFIGSGACGALCLGSRVPGFARWKAHHGRDIGTYLAQRKNGLPIDPELRLYAKNGFTVLWPIENYFPDSESEDFGAMLLSRDG